VIYQSWTVNAGYGCQEMWREVYFILGRPAQPRDGDNGSKNGDRSWVHGSTGLHEVASVGPTRALTPLVHAHACKSWGVNIPDDVCSLEA
jgi:hypothetical protein